MRGFREVERIDIIEKLNREKREREIEEKGYKQIKPHTDMTVEEANAFINNLFMSMKEE